jgi:hypothetical protein
MDDDQIARLIREAYQTKAAPDDLAQILQYARQLRKQPKGHRAGMQDRKLTHTHLDRPVLMPSTEQRTLGAAPLQARERHRRIPSWALTAVITFVCLLAGGGLGYLLRGPTPSPVPVPTVVTKTVVRTVTKPVAPPSCLETARRGDEAMDLLVRNVRDRRLAAALKAYTSASQACRKQAPR